MLYQKLEKFPEAVKFSESTSELLKCVGSTECWHPLLASSGMTVSLPIDKFFCLAVQNHSHLSARLQLLFLPSQIVQRSQTISSQNSHFIHNIWEKCLVFTLLYLNIFLKISFKIVIHCKRLLFGEALPAIKNQSCWVTKEKHNR